MKVSDTALPHQSRYTAVTGKKAAGETYTPRKLADFVSRQILSTNVGFPGNHALKIFDPAVGDGELLMSLLSALERQNVCNVEVFGHEPNEKSLGKATSRISKKFSSAKCYFRQSSFLDTIENVVDTSDDLFSSKGQEKYDLIIANPPYVRTQILGAQESQLISKKFGLTGRIDLYHPFVLGIYNVLAPTGTAGIIVSNRFMTTRSGAAIRRFLLEKSAIRKVWDLGDTKLFDAAILPAVLIYQRKDQAKRVEPTSFSSIYETTLSATETSDDPILALEKEGVISISDGRRFHVKHGHLHTPSTPNDTWRIATSAVDKWLQTVESQTWGVFGDIGKIHVGVKTCADSVFVRNDWHELPETQQPELLRKVTTHHIARSFKALNVDPPMQILYPHEMANGQRRAIDLKNLPRTNSYLCEHRSALESRKYLIDSGRKWYEIWVPQNPDAWAPPKLVFRDIAQKPQFWVDLDGTVVNGDCYWLSCAEWKQTHLLWLASAVANSSFIGLFYDYSYNNKLYAGRRRFQTQYVEKFPLPNPTKPICKEIVYKAKQVYDSIPSDDAAELMDDLDSMVWQAFGLSIEEIHW